MPVLGSKNASSILQEADRLIDKIPTSSPFYMKAMSIRSLMDQINETDLEELENLKQTLNQTVTEEEKARARSFLFLVLGVSAMAIGFALLQKLRQVDEEILNYLASQDRLLTTNQIAESLNRSWATTQSHLLEMVSRGLVDHLEIGNCHAWRLNERGKRFLK